jgi:cyclophilin family peptidyl-prolyl cis-trans isomerase
MSSRSFIAIFFVLLFLPLTAGAEPESVTPKSPVVVMETSMGTIKIELFEQDAPLSVKNFRNYVNQGFYNGLIFHRVIPKFMIQGGGLEPGLKRRNPTQPPVANEATNGLKNKRGTLAMARTGQIHSATSQFFINVVDNISLDNHGTLPHQFGYAVFGKVIDGMDIVDKIVGSPTTTASGRSDVPRKDIIMSKVYEQN